MKHTVFAILFCLPIICLAKKDPCRNITKVEYHKEGITRFNSPIDFNLGGFVYISRYIEQAKKVDEVAVIVVLYGPKDIKKGRGVSLTLEDGTVLKDDSARINCTYSSDAKFKYFVAYEVDNEHYQMLTQKKIVKVQTVDQSREIPEKEGKALIDYLKCVRNPK